MTALRRDSSVHGGDAHRLALVDDIIADVDAVGLTGLALAEADRTQFAVNGVLRQLEAPLSLASKPGRGVINQVEVAGTSETSSWNSSRSLTQAKR